MSMRDISVQMSACNQYPQRDVTGSYHSCSGLAFTFPCSSFPMVQAEVMMDLQARDGAQGRNWIVRPLMRGKNRFLDKSSRLFFVFSLVIDLPSCMVNLPVFGWFLKISWLSVAGTEHKVFVRNTFLEVQDRTISCCDVVHRMPVAWDFFSRRPQ